MRTIASLFFLFIAFHATAQRECTTQAYNKIAKVADKAAAYRINKVELPIKQQAPALVSGIAGNATGTIESNIIRIPVVVHVLYNTAAENISDEQIKSGIAALNRDFRRQNKDTINTPERFKSLAADVEIEFHLATADQKGVTTTGIIRKQTTVPAFNMDDKIKSSAQGGDDAWDSKQYLNIWLGNTRRLLGYATMPGGDEKLDGLVINSSAFGTIKTAAPYNLGRTAVHETGHWLGLHHLWGDDACGDDFVEDTPKQGGYTSGCPTGIRKSCGNDAEGDMYMNYMDFTNDACMNLFTQGQKVRMRSVFAKGGLRHSMLSSAGLSQPWVEAAPLPKEDSVAQKLVFHLYPNPAVQNLVLHFEGMEIGTGGELQVVNLNGLQMQKIKITTGTQKLNLMQLKPGVYFIHGVINNTRINQKFFKL